MQMITQWRLKSVLDRLRVPRTELRIRTDLVPEPVAKPARVLPYPVTVTRRDPSSEPPAVGGGLECFETPNALAINRARMEHLHSLGLPLRGASVLDVGCGPGHLAQYFVGQGCKVVCIDGRDTNIAALRQLYPRLEAHVGDAQTFPLASLGRFDAVFSYGLLYHLEDPIAGLRNMASVGSDILLLETLICDSAETLTYLVDEPLSFNQTLESLACRPSPSYVAMTLNRVGFPWVYAPKTKPAHQDFQFEWRNDRSHTRDGHPIRCVFVASRTPLDNPQFVDLLS
jgi:2-polyprenyl-3-methyl-5-hydroxy-6-metoxy-1,4-benzoquinol methylase